MRIKLLSKNVIGRDHLGDKRIDVRIVPKWILKNWCVRRMNSVGSGKSPGVGCIENSCLINGGE
jgi:hypothetical protein